MEAWIAEVWRLSAGRCVVCGARPGGGDSTRPLDIRLEGHHIITQQHMRGIALDLGIAHSDLCWDPRFGVLVCAGIDSQHCHFRHTYAVERIPISRVPEYARQRVADLGLEHYLERYYAG